MNTLLQISESYAKIKAFLSSFPHDLEAELDHVEQALGLKTQVGNLEPKVESDLTAVAEVLPPGSPAPAVGTSIAGEVASSPEVASKAPEETAAPTGL